ncbi:MAG: hypothetical protein ABIQ18_46960 [Umezawaea sp.]
MIPVDPLHTAHLLTFQLGYLGVGEITVHIALEAVDGVGEPTDRMELTTAVLSGVDLLEDVPEASRRTIPSVELSYVTLPNRQIDYRYTVWGQTGDPQNDLRGELSTLVSGTLPTLRATTRAGATRKALPLPRFGGRSMITAARRGDHVPTGLHAPACTQQPA